VSAPRNGIPEFTRVLVPTDFSKAADKAVAFAYGVMPRGGEVSLVHVIPSGNPFDCSTKGKNGRHLDRKKNLAARLRSRVPKNAKTRGIRSRVEVVEHQHPAAAIAQAAERAGAHLICMGLRGRTGPKKKLLGSVTESVMRRSKRPVLIIRN
jgi:nucleotide-binding universal stress UspA family protein